LLPTFVTSFASCGSTSGSFGLIIIWSTLGLALGFVAEITAALIAE
jgi:hypothetical protein